MGGGPKQVNSGQAGQADAATQALEQQQAGFSKQLQGQEQQQYSNMFGDDGKSGSLSKFMDPNSLNVSAPTGAYSTIFNNASNQLAQNYALQRGQLAQSFANNGFAAGMPNGMMADQQRKLSASEADSRGNLFTGLSTQSYQDALNNFWNANNIAAGQSANATSGANSAAAAAGNEETNIYGTAGKQATPSPIPGALIGAGGTVGAALACPAAGCAIGVRSGELAVEALNEDSEIEQMPRSHRRLAQKPIPVKQACVRVVRNDGKSSVVSATHTYSLRHGGYCYAAEARYQEIRSRAGYVVIVAVEPVGERDVYPLEIGGNHTYLCDGLWSLE